MWARLEAHITHESGRFYCVFTGACNANDTILTSFPNVGRAFAPARPGAGGMGAGAHAEEGQTRYEAGTGVAGCGLC